VLAALWTTTSTYACTCAPRGFTWTLDFSLGCEPQSVLVGSGTGILDVTCNIENTDSTMTDITPVSVTEYAIFELDPETLAAIPESVVSSNNLNLVSGDSIDYVRSSTLQPAGLQTQVIGLTADGSEVELNYTLRYTQDCNAYVFFEGDSLGWLFFDIVLSPDGDVCTIAAETTTPSVAPSVAPSNTVFTSSSPTISPTFAETLDDSSSPTISPTFAETPDVTIITDDSVSSSSSKSKSSNSKSSASKSKSKGKGSKSSSTESSSKSSKSEKGSAANKMKHKAYHNLRNPSLRRN